MNNNISDTNQQSFVIKEKLAALEEALLAATPNMPVLLKDIHTILRKDPDVVTILSEEECAIIVSGLKKQTRTEIAVSTLKSTPKKSLKQMTIEDL